MIDSNMGVICLKLKYPEVTFPQTNWSKHFMAFESMPSLNHFLGSNFLYSLESHRPSRNRETAATARINTKRMGGKIRSIPIVEIENKQIKSVSFTKRRKGLFSKASGLCLLSPNTQIAILATPPSSNSHASFYSFGHSSVDHVVSSLLQDQSPLPTNQSGFWWEDERFDKLDNVDELKEASSAVSRMLNNVRLRLDDALKKEQRDNRALVIHQQQHEEEVLQLCNTTRSNNEETMDQVPGFVGALVIHQKEDQEEEEALQICNTNQNDNEETTNQIPKFGGASGSGFASLLENDEDALRIDELMSECQFVPL